MMGSGGRDFVGEVAEDQVGTEDVVEFGCRDDTHRIGGSLLEWTEGEERPPASFEEFEQLAPTPVRGAVRQAVTFLALEV